jgi:phosphate transport system substrate-binding protein
VIRSKNRAPRWWFPLAGSTIAALFVTVALIIGELFGPRPPQGQEHSLEPLSADGRSVHLAGTGTWLPLARALEDAFETEHPEIDVVVHQSIGSRGGRRAVSDGRIDIGLSASHRAAPRPLECCEAIEVARSAVVFAVNSTVRESSVTDEEVVEIFAGRRTRWSDGQTIVPLLRERGDTSTAVARREIPGFGVVADAALLEARWPTLLTDAEMGRALVETPGAIGLYDLGVISFESARLRVLAINGVEPNRQTLGSGQYPLSRSLVMYVRRDPRPAARAFIRFVRSERGQAVVRQGDVYLTLEGER